MAQNFANIVQADHILYSIFEDGLDLVLVRCDATATSTSIKVGLGLWFWDRLQWCGNTALWQPSGSGKCVFVPTGDPLGRHYTIEHGAIFAIDGPPWTDEIDRTAGFDRANQSIARLMAVR